MQRKLWEIINVDFEATGSNTDYIFCIRHIKKGKVIPFQARRVGRGIVLLFHDLGTRRG